ncbi:hypothetical protein ACJMK2_014069 [Sinanodonta woodiana]|uniref:Uncharacterized protein n=1 Tax=Sinanodonta woodiana TaxID=1069815 RepID=A0ABD3UZG7_SINWO
MIHWLNRNQNTPAHKAAYSGNISVLIFLIDHEADPWYRTLQEETLLHRACINGQLEMTMYLVETYPEMLHMVDKSKSTPGHNAAVSGNVDVLSYLIDHGTDPWCRSLKGETLLHHACNNGQLQMTMYIVETYTKMIYMVDNSKNTPAHHAAHNGNVAILRYLIPRGANPWRKTAQQQTLLHIACLSGQFEMIKYLTDTFPKMLREVDKSNKTPARQAAKCGNVAVLKYLIDHGANPWCRSYKGETLLHIAYHHGKLEIIKYLMETYPEMQHVDKS